MLMEDGMLVLDSVLMEDEDLMENGMLVLESVLMEDGMLALDSE
jgi:hypothetical protein